MARLRASASVEQDDHSTVLQNSSRASSHVPLQARRQPRASPSPTPSNSSDKENQRQQSSRTSMGPPPVPNKRLRLGGPPDSAGAPTSREGSVGYDPHQDISERQQIRKGLRDLNRDATEYRNEWLRPGHSGLLDAINQSNTFFSKVKQTSDATIDSRFLVTAGDLAYKKTQQASIGDGSQGVDVDEFISKCIAFMRNGDEIQEANRPNGMTATASSSTQPRRQRRTQLDDSDDEDDIQAIGDALNWAWLGSRACAPVNVRPPVPSFLLGPLSVHKKARQQKERRARQARLNPEEAVRPRELQLEDLQQQENSSLTHMCKKIHRQLGSIVREVHEAEESEDVDDEGMDALCNQYHVLDDGGISLMHFVVNPKSFGQTVENLFYVSFLIRDGLVGVEADSNGLPTLHVVDRKNADETRQASSHAATRYQAVLSLDFSDWQNVIEAWNIEKSLIEDRSNEEEVSANVGQSTWYGS